MSARDLPVVFASQRDAHSIAEMSRDLIEHGLGWQYRRERIAGMIADRDTVAVVTRDGPRVAGFAFMTFGPERGHLVLLAVQPSHHRQGLARRMIAWLSDSAVVAGVVSIHVELRASNHGALAFYRREGFTETLRVPGYYRGRESAIRMMRLLRTPGGTVPAWRPPTFDGRTR
ncbi:MAG: GNAT family N-acetyltransferase [Burkholderiales bacterium]